MDIRWDDPNGCLCCCLAWIILLTHGCEWAWEYAPEGADVSSLPIWLISTKAFGSAPMEVQTWHDLGSIMKTRKIREIVLANPRAWEDNSQPDGYHPMDVCSNFKLTRWLVQLGHAKWEQHLIRNMVWIHQAVERTTTWLAMTIYAVFQGIYISNSM